MGLSRRVTGIGAENVRTFFTCFTFNPFFQRDDGRTEATESTDRPILSEQCAELNV